MLDKTGYIFGDRLKTKYLFIITGGLMDRELILQKFETLNLARKDGARAPHKPLRVICAIEELMRGKDPSIHTLKLTRHLENS